MNRKKIDYVISYIVIGKPYYFPSRKDALEYAKRNKIASYNVKVYCEIIESGYFFVASGIANTINQAKINAFVDYKDILRIRSISE